MSEATDNYIQTILSGQPLPSGGLAWLQCGFLDHMATGQPLHKGLGLNRGAYMMNIRNHHLMNALQEINSRHSESRRAEILIGKIEALTMAESYQDMDTPDPRWSRLRQEIFSALKCNIRMPTSAKQILNIWKFNGR